jgi:single-strand DNA-binding protein
LCQVVEQYLKKGSKVYLEGQLQTRKWTDQQGVERYTTEVVLQNFRGELTLLDRAGGGGTAEGPDQGGDDFGAAGPTAGRDRQPAMSSSRRNELDDDIPF